MVGRTKATVHFRLSPRSRSVQLRGIGISFTTLPSTVLTRRLPSQSRSTLTSIGFRLKARRNPLEAKTVWKLEVISFLLIVQSPMKGLSRTAENVGEGLKALPFGNKHTIRHLLEIANRFLVFSGNIFSVFFQKKPVLPSIAMAFNGRPCATGVDGYPQCLCHMECGVFSKNSLRHSISSTQRRLPASPRQSSGTGFSEFGLHCVEDVDLGFSRAP